MEASEPVSFLLTYFLLPVWILAGFADYLCHRATDIEHANGATESAIHWLMLAEVGVPLVAAVFLKVNALLLLFFVLCIIAHLFTTHWDLQVAIRTRKVTAFEQQVHSVLEGVPAAGLMLLIVMHWPQVEALFGRGSQLPDYSLRIDLPTNWAAVLIIFAATTLLLLAPYSEELIRGLLVKRLRALPKQAGLSRLDIEH
jgi:hypothetical protein